MVAVQVLVNNKISISFADKNFVVRALAAGKGVFWFFDFDGTLAPIAPHPKDAALPSDVKKWLRLLLLKERTKVAVVTGRSLADIRRRVALKNAYYVANHGMEIFHDGKFLLKKGLEFRRPLKKLGGRLLSSLTHVPGVFIEEKGLSVAVHFRQVPKGYHPSVRKIVRTAAKPFLKKYALQLTGGKMLFEVRPAKLWNKGKAVKWLWEKIAPSYFPVYVGDDITDEDAFKALNPHGLTIRVGKKKQSHAEYYISSIRAITNAKPFLRLRVCDQFSIKERSI